jgi:RHS repeat-associated protein
MTIARDSATGFVSGATLGSVSETRTYNAFGEGRATPAAPARRRSTRSTTAPRDALGRIVSKTETVQGETHVFGYSYDTQGRLSDVTRDGAATSHYEYDANGNRTVAPDLTASPAYDNQDRLISYGSCTYSYKADGSLQTKTCLDGTTSYDYDAFGNLRHVTVPNGTNIDYVIDGQNRRVGKKVNGVLVEGFLYRSQLQPAVWLNPDASIRATFVYSARGNVPEYMVKGGTTYRLFTDQVRSLRLVVDPTGNVAQRVDYDEFGNVLADSAPGFQPFGFAGGLRDLDTGLTRFGARDYDAVTGRWTAKDPIRFEGGQSNLYLYVVDNPINRADPTGLRLLIDPLVEWYLRHFNPRRLKALNDAIDQLGGSQCRCALTSASGYNSAPWDRSDIYVGFDSIGSSIIGASGYSEPYASMIWLNPREDDSASAYAQTIAHEAGHFRWPYLGHDDLPNRFNGELVCGSMDPNAGANAAVSSRCRSPRECPRRVRT